jgi:hypothetical protein
VAKMKKSTKYMLIGGAIGIVLGPVGIGIGMLVGYFVGKK